MYFIVNVENLRLYEPPLIDDQGSDIQLPSIEDFSPAFLDELKEGAILNRRTRTSKRGSVDYLRIWLKGSKPSKARLMVLATYKICYSKRWLKLFEPSRNNFIAKKLLALEEF